MEWSEFLETRPTKEEIYQTINMARRFMGLEWSDFTVKMGFDDPNYLRSLLRRPRSTVMPEMAVELRQRLYLLIDKELDPTYCPVQGMEKEWYTSMQGLRAFLRGAALLAMPDPPKQRRTTRLERRMKRRQMRPRYIGKNRHGYDEEIED